MPRLHLHLTDHPYWCGAVVAALLLPIALVSVEVLNDSINDLPYVAWAIAFSVPAILMFRRPEWAFGMALVPVAVQVVRTDRPLGCDVILLAALAVIAAQRPWRQTRWWGLASAALSAVLALDWSLHRGIGSDWEQALTAVALFGVTAGLFGLSIVLGSLIRSQRSQAAAWQATADALERDREMMMDLAASQERARIAADMHDIVAHSLAVIAVQTDAAQLLLASPSPTQDQRDKALRAVEAAHETSVTALRDTRQLVGALSDDPDAQRAPQPTLVDLPELVGRIDPGGARFRIDTDVDLARVPVSLPAQAACHRIVGEALSNVIHHAGPRAHGTVDLHVEGEELVTTISDDGRGGAPISRTGHGLGNMEQRARSAGGTLTAGPGPNGGFVVTARVPLITRGEDA